MWTYFILKNKNFFIHKINRNPVLFYKVLKTIKIKTFSPVSVSVFWLFFNFRSLHCWAVFAFIYKMITDFE